MSTIHSEAARRFNDNRAKTTWHDATFWSLRQKRDNMASGLPEWEELREHASQIKQHTITHLADYLEEFSTQLESRGVIVHWAKDSNDFNNIALDILQSHGVKKMVKSKSMLTEECAMNPFLESHGIDVVETDLGERILQLLHQKPSHIVMPAIHLKREEVGQMFEEKGISTEKGNYDPTYLTQCARKHLRNQFMEAGAGMTGCKFGVAKPGDIVGCSDEGCAASATPTCQHQCPSYISWQWEQRRLCPTTSRSPYSSDCSAALLPDSPQRPTPHTSVRQDRERRCTSSSWTTDEATFLPTKSIGKR